MALVELLAYVGDHLSYYQDAVATEAYLEHRAAARLGPPPRPAGRLPAARGLQRPRLGLRRDRRRPHGRAGELGFVTGSMARAPALAPRADAALADVAPAGYEWFEPVRACSADGAAGRAQPDRSTPGATASAACHGAPRPPPCSTEWDAGAPKGYDDRPLALRPNDFLLLEEVLGARTGKPADADPARRHVVRLTRVHRDVDQLTGTHIVDVEWCPEDALPFPLCLSSTGRPPECRPLDDVSVARGNVIAVDHGRTVAPPEDLGQVPGEPLPATCDPCDDAGGGFVPGRYRPSLSGTPLTFGQPAPARARRCGCSTRIRGWPRPTLASTAFLR